MNEMRLTVEQATNFVMDPRNDRGPFVVMGFAVTSDCPDYESHEGQHVLWSEQGWWNNDRGWVAEQADASIFRGESWVTADVPDAPGARWEHDICMCWDGVTEDELDDETGMLDASSGPFALWYECDEVPVPQVWTPAQVIEDLVSYAGMRIEDDDFIPTYRKDRLERALAHINEYAEALAGGGVLMKAEDIEGGECSDNAEDGTHVIALNMCVFCLQYDVLGIR